MPGGFIHYAQVGRIDKVLRKVRSDMEMKRKKPRPGAGALPASRPRTRQKEEEKKDDGWRDERCEVYLWNEISKMFDGEVATYSALEDHQEHLIPRLLSQTTLYIYPSDTPDIPQGKVRVAFLEYLPGFHLRHMTRFRLPRRENNPYRGPKGPQHGHSYR